MGKPSMLAVTLVAVYLAAGQARAQYELVWSDEFDGATIDEDHWSRDVYPGVVRGSQELAYYTARPANSFIEDGRLVIAVSREEHDNSAFTTARLHTYGKHEFLYGRIEARVRLPRGPGLRSKLSLLPVELEYGSWAASGEIVAFEALELAPEIRGGLFFGGSGPHHQHVVQSYDTAGSIGDDFHVLAVEWQPYEMRWYLDGQRRALQNRWSSAGAPYPAPFDKPFYLALSATVVKGVDPAAITWPQKMYVDWIRVYQAKNNQPPRVTLTRPLDGSKHPAGEVLIEARASDPDDDLEKVEFYLGDALIGTDDSAPYSFTWKAPDGCHTLIVRALDRTGFACADSVSIECGVGCPPTPFHETPATVPGRIEAEDYDFSLKGESYFDTDPGNNGGAYRLEECVDVQPCSEGGFNVCWVLDNEWMQYTIAVARAGRYDLRCRVASPKDTARFRVEFEGVDRTGSLLVPRTGDWQRYTDVVVRNVQLSAGRQVMRVFAEKDGFNFNYIEISEAPRQSTRSPE